MEKVINADGLDVYLFVWDFVDSNAYVLEDEGTALVIDPVDTEEFWGFIERQKIRTADVVLTHEHFDHISGLNKLREKMGCKVYAHRKCSENIGIITRNLSSAAGVLVQVSEKLQGKDLFGEPFICAPADVIFDENHVFFWKGHKVEMTHTPGHSAGSICVVLEEEILFSGDTLLEEPTITRLPGGNKRIFCENTMPWLKEKLTMMKWILPGHGMLIKNIFDNTYIK